MTTFLDKMKRLKLEEIRRDESALSLERLKAQADQMPPSPSMAQSLRRQEGASISLIAEVKAKAPGRENVAALDPVAIVNDYLAGGVSAISVLTDTSYFGGSLETLETVRSVTSLPLLHKEFIVSPYQLFQGRIRGASAALILVYYFQESDLRRILAETRKAGVEAVVECSLESELPRALAVNPDILLINNRPIAAIPEDPGATYRQGSVEVSGQWWEKYQELRQWKSRTGKVLISASCINTPDDVQKIARYPFDAVLVGNAAMVAEDRAQFLKDLRKNTEKRHETPENRLSQTER